MCADFISYRSKEMQKWGSPFGEPCFLCMGRTKVCFSDAGNDSIELCGGITAFKVWKDKKNSFSKRMLFRDNGTTLWLT